jgi:hypothetical protein
MILKSQPKPGLQPRKRLAIVVLCDEPLLLAADLPQLAIADRQAQVRLHLADLLLDQVDIHFFQAQLPNPDVPDSLYAQYAFEGF